LDYALYSHKLVSRGVHSSFPLWPEVLFLTVNYVDRFLSCKYVPVTKLLLVGITALSIAAKFENTWNSSIESLVDKCDNAYTLEDIRKAEVFMLQMLNYNLGWPGPLIFLRRINEIDDCDSEPRMLVKYLLEASTIEERFVAERLSIVAASAYCLAMYMLKIGEWVSSSLSQHLNIIH
jgi:hypothetical protein